MSPAAALSQAPSAEASCEDRLRSSLMRTSWRTALGHWPLWLLLGISVLTHLAWFTSRGYITAGDVGLYPDRFLNQLGTTAMSAQVGTGLGGPDLLGSSHPLLLAYSGLGHLGLTFPIAFRLLVLWPSLLISSVSAYGLTRQVLKSQVGVLVGSCVLLFNTYTLLIQATALTIVMADALLVLWLSQLLRLSTHGPTRRRLIRFGLTAVALAAYDFRIFYIGGCLLGLVSLYFGLWLRSWKPLAYVASGTTATLLLNLPWLFSLGSHGLLASNAIVNRPLFGSGFFDLTSSVTLFHRYWTGSALAYFTRQPIPPYALLIPLGAAFGLVVARRNRKVILFALIAAIGILLSKQTAEPFPGLYTFLFDHFPGFHYFREASKFYELTAIGYAVLLGSFADWVWGMRLGSDWRRAAATFVVTLVACPLLLNARPLVRGTLGATFVTHTPPKDYRGLDALLPRDGEFFRTLWLPAQSRWAPYDLDHPAVSLTDAIAGAWSGVPGLGAPSDDAQSQQQLEHFFTGPYSHDLLDGASIRYVVVPVRDTAQEDDVFNGVDRALYIDAVNRLPWLRKVNLQTQDLAVYENSSWAPAVVADGAVAVRRNLTQYSVTLRGSRAEPARVTLAIPYDPSWVLSPIPLRPYACGSSRDFQLSRIQHPVPAATTAAVGPGDTFQSIASARGIDLGMLLQLNKQPPSAAKRKLKPGSRIVLTAAAVFRQVRTTACDDEDGQGMAVGLAVREDYPPATRGLDTDKWLTSWSLASAEVAAHFPSNSWRRNTDGTYDLAFSLTYKPQASFNRGLLLSAIALLGIMAGFVAWPVALRGRRLSEWASSAGRAPEPALVERPQTAPRILSAGYRFSAAVGLRSWLVIYRNCGLLIQRLERTPIQSRALILRWRGAAVGSHVQIGRGAIITGHARLVVGSDVVIGLGCAVDAHGGVVLGDGCRLGTAVIVASSAAGAIRVGSGASIGPGAVLCAGAQIPVAGVVAAGAVVERPAPHARGVSG